MNFTITTKRSSVGGDIFLKRYAIKGQQMIFLKSMGENKDMFQGYFHAKLLVFVSVAKFCASIY